MTYSASARRGAGDRRRIVDERRPGSRCRTASSGAAGSSRMAARRPASSRVSASSTTCRVAPGRRAGDSHARSRRRVRAELAEAGQHLDHVRARRGSLPRCSANHAASCGLAWMRRSRSRPASASSPGDVGHRGVDEGVGRKQRHQPRVVAQRHVGELRHHLLAAPRTARGAARRSAPGRLDQATSSATGTGAMFACVAVCSPGASLVTVLPCSTHTSPSRTETRDPFGPWRDREDRALDRDLAVGGVDVEMASLALLGRLDDDAAALELDRHAVPARLDGELGVLVHLDARAVGETQHRARAAARCGPPRTRAIASAARDRDKLPVVDAEQACRRRARPPPAPAPARPSSRSITPSLSADAGDERPRRPRAPSAARPDQPESAGRRPRLRAGRSTATAPAGSSRRSACDPRTARAAPAAACPDGTRRSSRRTRRSPWTTPVARGRPPPAGGACEPAPDAVRRRPSPRWREARSLAQPPRSPARACPLLSMSHRVHDDALLSV